MLYSCPLEATINGATRCRSHQYRKAQEQLEQAHSLPVTVGLHDPLGRSLADRWRTCTNQSRESQRHYSLQPGHRTRRMKGCGAGRRSQHKRQRALEAGTVRALLPAAQVIASRERRSFRTARAALRAMESRRRSLSRHTNNATGAFRKLVRRSPHGLHPEELQGRRVLVDPRAPDGNWCRE